MSDDFVRCEIDAGEIKAVRFGRKWRIPYPEVERYLTDKGFPLPRSA